MHRLEQHRFAGLTLTLKIRFHDFTTRTKSLTAAAPYVTREAVWRAALRLLAGVEIPPDGVRLLGLSVSTPIVPREPDDPQGSLF